jgi:hypothetical protein
MGCYQELIAKRLLKSFFNAFLEGLFLPNNCFTLIDHLESTTHAKSSDIK